MRKDDGAYRGLRSRPLAALLVALLRQEKYVAGTFLAVAPIHVL